MARGTGCQVEVRMGSGATGGRRALFDPEAGQVRLGAGRIPAQGNAGVRGVRGLEVRDLGKLGLGGRDREDGGGDRILIAPARRHRRDAVVVGRVARELRHLVAGVVLVRGRHLRVRPRTVRLVAAVNPEFLELGLVGGRRPAQRHAGVRDRRSLEARHHRQRGLPRGDLDDGRGCGIPVVAVGGRPRRDAVVVRRLALQAGYLMFRFILARGRYLIRIGAVAGGGARLDQEILETRLADRRIPAQGDAGGLDGAGLEVDHLGQRGRAGLDGDSHLGRIHIVTVGGRLGLDAEPVGDIGLQARHRMTGGTGRGWLPLRRGAGGTLVLNEEGGPSRGGGGGIPGQGHTGVRNGGLLEAGHRRQRGLGRRDREEGRGRRILIAILEETVLGHRRDAVVVGRVARQVLQRMVRGGLVRGPCLAHTRAVRRRAAVNLEFLEPGCRGGGVPGQGHAGVLEGGHLETLHHRQRGLPRGDRDDGGGGRILVVAAGVRPRRDAEVVCRLAIQAGHLVTGGTLGPVPRLRGTGAAVAGRALGNTEILETRLADRGRPAQRDAFGFGGRGLEVQHGRQRSFLRGDRDDGRGISILITAVGDSLRRDAEVVGRGTLQAGHGKGRDRRSHVVHLLGCIAVRGGSATINAEAGQTVLGREFRPSQIHTVMGVRLCAEARHRRQRRLQGPDGEDGGRGRILVFIPGDRQGGDAEVVGRVARQAQHRMLREVRTQIVGGQGTVAVRGRRAALDAEAGQPYLGGRRVPQQPHVALVGFSS